jgi:hypothetical protein
VLPRWNLKGAPNATNSGESGAAARHVASPSASPSQPIGERVVTRVITREWLHAQLWQRPATDVARELEMTSTAVAKIARKLAVPVPPPGHWARKRAGQSVEVVALAAPLAGQPTRHLIVRRVQLGRLIDASREPEADVRRVELASPVEASAPPAADVRTPAPVTPEEAMLAAASRGLAALERVATLRAFVDKLAPVVGSLPPDSPQRRWLDDARAQIAVADAAALAELGL